LLTLGLLIGIGALPAQAQPRYELDDEGTLVEIDQPDPDSPEGELYALRRQLAEGETDGLVDAVTLWIETYPQSPDAPVAYLLRGDTRFAEGNYYIAIADYEAIIGLFPGTETYQTALEREYDIAMRFVNGLKRRGRNLPFRWWDAKSDGVELLIRVQERLPGSRLGERASIAIGDHFFRQGEMELATEAYDIFMLNYPRSNQREWALLRLIQASLARFKGPEFDPSGLFEAQARLDQYASEFPAAAERIGVDALLVRINESLGAKEMATASWYEQRGERISAVSIYRQLIVDYPQTAAAREALAKLDAWGQPIVDPRDPALRANRDQAPAPEIELEVVPDTP